MILLWMDGGPSQYDTFNPKPGSEFQGPTQAIHTNVPGIEIGEHWPKTAQVFDKIALIRSMVSDERDHFRAIKLVRTGYPIKPTIPYPTWGSVVARDRWDPGFDLPAFVRIGKPRIKTRDVNSGVLGPRYESFKIDEPGKLPEDVHPAVAARSAPAPPGPGRQARRAVRRPRQRQGRQRAARNLRPHQPLRPQPAARARSISTRSRRSSATPTAATRSARAACSARRLVEAGVSFVEVINGGTLNDQGWDTHKRGFKENPILAGETDSGYATLLTDLADRGMLENTLVVWMGEFCRTPKYEDDAGGRNHYSEGWLVGFSGGGVKMGQVIGATDKDNVKVTDRPIGVPDLFVTFCHVLGLDPHDEYFTDQNQPLKLVEGGELIKELF